MLKSKIFKATISLLGVGGIVGGMTTSLISCAHHSSWDDFKTKALNASASDLIKSLSSKTLTSYGWVAGDVAAFANDGNPQQVKDHNEIVAMIEIQSKK